MGLALHVYACCTGFLCNSLSNNSDQYIFDAVSSLLHGKKTLFSDTEDSQARAEWLELLKSPMKMRLVCLLFHDTDCLIFTRCAYAQGRVHTLSTDCLTIFVTWVEESIRRAAVEAASQRCKHTERGGRGPAWTEDHIWWFNCLRLCPPSVLRLVHLYSVKTGQFHIYHDW